MKISNCVFAFTVALLPILVHADTGSTILPAKECKGEKIECTTWYEKVDACDTYFNDPEYFVAGGSVGASVQHYTFCKKSAEDTPSSQRVDVTLFASLLGVCICVGIGARIIRTIRKKHA
ncbi:hypothetical protein HY620_00345 [Candidatus Uhrbacteria bacterium]|nr:hypothetical protein [Candidatus Uhrbacteria bacterium]